jgi:hypothetical protein
MDENFLKEQAERCRSLAESADKFTKIRLLNLAAHYDARLGRPSLAARALLVTPAVNADDRTNTR